MKTKLSILTVLLIAAIGTKAQKWETYTNNKLGFSFQYPSTWKQQGKEIGVINRQGTTTTININFTDTISETTLLIQYHLAPTGVEYYQYVTSQYASSKGWYARDSKKIEVARNKAIEAFTEISIDGRGKKLNPPLKLIVVDFLDKQQIGEIELQLKTPLPNEYKEVTIIKHILSTFSFIKI